MSAGDADRASFRVKTIGERRADCQDAATGTLPCFQGNDSPPGFSKNIGGAQPRQTGADHDDGRAGAGTIILRESAQERRHRRSGKGGQLEKPPTSEVPPHVTSPCLHTVDPPHSI